MYSCIPPVPVAYYGRLFKPKILSKLFILLIAKCARMPAPLRAVFCSVWGVPSVLIQIAPAGDDKIHTNSMESFWSLLERSTKGTYVTVEPVHLFQFLNERAFRFINRTGRERSGWAISGVVLKRPMLDPLIRRELLESCRTL